MQNKIPLSNTTNHPWPAISAAVLLAAVPALVLPTNLTWKAEATVKQSYDSNLYLQNTAPNAYNVSQAQAAGLKPVEANKGSFLTTFTPKVSLAYKPAAAFNVSAGYAPEMALYYSAEDEDYITHRGTVNFNGACNDASWELLNAATYIQGSTQGPTFARPDDIPAIGGIPIRDRRAAFIDHNNFRLTQTAENWLIRPVASVYIHDFLTEQLYQSTKTNYSYENYVDRDEYAGGVDIGYKAVKNTYLLAGFRFGRQNQGTLPGANGTTTYSHYGNYFERALVGVEGSPWTWLKLAVLAGPDFREFDAGTPAGFDRNKLLYYWDASATVMPDKKDTITLKSVRYEQPAFSSFSMYQDIKTDLAWRHQFNDRISTLAGFTLYVGDWEEPVQRDDWIYTPSAAVTYNFDKHLSAELSYSYDWAQNKINSPSEPLADNHKFRRHLVSVSVKYVF